MNEFANGDVNAIVQIKKENTNYSASIFKTELYHFDLKMITFCNTCCEC